MLESFRPWKLKLWNFWTFGILKLWNLETWKLRNFDFYFQLREFPTKGIPHLSTFRFQPLHQPPSWGTRRNSSDFQRFRFFEIRVSLVLPGQYFDRNSPRIPSASSIPSMWNTQVHWVLRHFEVFRVIGSSRVFRGRRSHVGAFKVIQRPFDSIQIVCKS